MSWILLVPAFLVGVACGISALYVSARDARTEAKNARSKVAEAEALLEPITAELEHARWGLGGRVRKPTDPPIYLMPPGQEKTGCCDDARLAWMEVANEAARILRAAGMGASADGIHPETRQANQPGLQTNR